jgi:hypothetical protein
MPQTMESVVKEAEEEEKGERNTSYTKHIVILYRNAFVSSYILAT